MDFFGGIFVAGQLTIMYFIAALIAGMLAQATFGWLGVSPTALTGLGQVFFWLAVIVYVPFIYYSLKSEWWG